MTIIICWEFVRLCKCHATMCCGDVKGNGNGDLSKMKTAKELWKNWSGKMSQLREPPRRARRGQAKRAGKKA